MARSLNDQLNNAIDQIRELREENRKAHFELASIYRSVGNDEKADEHQKQAEEI